MHGGAPLKILSWLVNPDLGNTFVQLQALGTSQRAWNFTSRRALKKLRGICVPSYGCCQGGPWQYAAWQTRSTVGLCLCLPFVSRSRARVTVPAQQPHFRPSLTEAPKKRRKKNRILRCFFRARRCLPQVVHLWRRSLRSRGKRRIDRSEGTKATTVIRCSAQALPWSHSRLNKARVSDRGLDMPCCRQTANQPLMS